VRIICWFPADDEVVIALIGFDKKTIGDVFYASAAARGEALVEAWLRQKGSTMTEDVKFIRGNDRISQLAQRPDLAEGVARVRRDMEEADRTHAMGLAALRQAAELTQVELARRMGVTQAAVSRIEQPHDLLLSTLNAYLEAVGGNATVIVRFADGHEAQLDLSQLTA
jgi:DNA-binding transcriptional regulator YiaG